MINDCGVENSNLESYKNYGARLRAGNASAKPSFCLTRGDENKWQRLSGAVYTCDSAYDSVYDFFWVAI